jgi:hypothetical protein
MTTKLTLTIEESVIKTAKKYAQKKGRSLSGLIENYLRTLSSKEAMPDELAPRVTRLRGCIKLPDDFDYKQSLADAITKKHGK